MEKQCKIRIMTAEHAWHADCIIMLQIKSAIGFTLHVKGLTKKGKDALSC